MKFKCYFENAGLYQRACVPNGSVFEFYASIVFKRKVAEIACAEPFQNTFKRSRLQLIL